MSTNYTQTPVSGINLELGVNDNLERLQEALENSLSRNSGDDNGSNVMNTDIDMNSKRIINLGAPQNDNDALRLVDVDVVQLAADVDAAAASAAAALVSEMNAETAETNAEAAAAEAAEDALAAQAAADSIIWNSIVYLTFADTPYTITDLQDGTLFNVDTTGGDVDINLPSIATLTPPFIVSITKTDASANDVIITPDGTDTIGGAASNTITAQTAGVTLTANPSAAPDDWTVNNYGGGTAFPDASITHAKIEDSAGLSVLGRAANTSGVKADIVAATDGEVLRRGGTSIGFGQVVAAGLAADSVESAKILDEAVTEDKLAINAVSTTKVVDKAITYAKIQNVSATSRILGRKTAAAGVIEECTLSEILDFIGSAAQGDILYRGAAGWARLGAGNVGQVLKTQGAGANPIWDTATGGKTQGTPQSLSGSTIDFNSLPAGIKEINVMFDAASLDDNGESFLLKLGDSGGIESSGYNSVVGERAGETGSTTGFILTRAPSSSELLYGCVTLRLLNGSTNLWVISGGLSDPTGPNVYYTFGSKALSSTLDRVRITCTNAGTTVYDGGTANISYSV
jgi:hypothetical protein